MNGALPHGHVKHAGPPGEPAGEGNAYGPPGLPRQLSGIEYGIGVGDPPPLPRVPEVPLREQIGPLPGGDGVRVGILRAVGEGRQ
ncbi:hypothetical protein SGLAM104S_09200 [Streptomyces glaucescens]